MNHPFTFRPGTQDESMFQEVVIANTYNLPDAFQGDEVIIDIGANIGAFTYAALIRGAGEVHAFEPDKGNYLQAQRNLRDFLGRAFLYHGAVWRSDRREGVIYYHGYDKETACGNVLDTRESTPVPAHSLDDVIRTISEAGRGRIDLVKIDCEGAEFPILLTAQLLNHVDCIVGEYHNFASGVPEGHPFYVIPEMAKVAGYDRFTDAELLPYLRQSGYEVSMERHKIVPHVLGTFVARRQRNALQEPANVWSKSA